MVATRHGEAWAAAARELGDRQATASAIGELSRVMRNMSGDPKGSLDLLLPAWEEFSDLEETPAGVRLMIQIAGSYGTMGDPSDLAWRERAIPIAERLGLVDELTLALNGLGATWMNIGRPRAGLVILRGSHALAIENGYAWAERQARNLLSFYGQWDDPAASLAMVREGFDIARKQGSTQYAVLIAGNGCICAFRVGDWDWAAAVMDDWLGREVTREQAGEFVVDRSVLRAWRGEDWSTDIAQFESIVADLSDPQFTAYLAWARAWQALTSGRFDEAVKQADAASDAITFFPPLARPLAARAALWAGDASTCASGT